MKKIVSIILALFLASCGSYQSASNSTAGSGSPVSETSSQKVTVQSVLDNMEKGKYREGEVLVKFKTGTTDSSSVTHQSVGASVEKQFAIVPGLELVKLPDNVSVSNAVAMYMSDPNVEYAEPNYLRRVYSFTPNDTYFVNQWGLHNTGHYAYGSNDADIDAPEAWSITTGNPYLAIAVIDTGIDYNHSDLVGNIWNNSGETTCIDGIDDEPNGLVDDCRGWNFVSNSNDPMDDNGHGTHVAGIIGAQGNNGEGITGVMLRVRLMPLKAFDSDGSGYDADIINAINYAVAKGAKVINASWGGSAYSFSMYDAINSADSEGVLFVAAAGNGDDDGVGDNNDFTPAFPASFNLENIISVAATDQRDERVSFSNYGPLSVDVAAPGVYIWSTVPNWWSTYMGYGILESFAGTSMAAPHVTGLAGLLMSYYDGVQNTIMTHRQVRSTIFRTCDWPPSVSGWIAFGRINAHRAVSSLMVPINLSANAQDADDSAEITSSEFSPSINLSWTNNATSEDGYRIERKKDGGFSVIATVGADTTAYNDPDLDPLTTYTYRVSAFNDIAVSMTSNEASATTFPGSGKVITKTGDGGCSITPGKGAGAVDLFVMLLPVAAVLMLITRRKR